jgi:prepilin-type processing-associated H-X9-DG protein
MAILADWDGSGMAGRNSSSQNHRGGQNVLYVDGSVKWQTTNYCSNDPIDDIFIEGGIGKNGAVVYWNADTDVYLVNAPTTLGNSYNEYTQLQQ